MTSLLIHLKELLLEDTQLVLDVLDISREGRLKIEALTLANLGETLLDSLSDLL